MSKIYEEASFQLLVLILKAQLKILNRLNENPMLVARPPLRVYVPIKEDNK